MVITGIGAVTPVGHGRDGLWRGVRQGRPAVRRITRFDPSPFASQVAAQIDDFDPLDYLDRRQARRLDRFSQLSLAAARQAVEDARLEPPSEAGVYLGSALGGVAYGEEQHGLYLERGVRGVSPMLALAVFAGAGAANVAMELGLRGPALANANSCAAGVVAVGEAFRLIRWGGAEVVLAGGAEAPLAPLTFGAFSIIRAMSTRNDDPATASRPFDADRDGFVMAEGAAVLVLEEAGHAARRGAAAYAEVLGYGHTNDAHHMTAPLPTGEAAARAIGLALAEAGQPPEAVEYVNAHGSATPLNDATETLALKRALGAHAPHVPVSGTKGLHGHALGATGAVETAVTALALAHGWLPPTTNLFRPDPACDLDHVRGEGRRARPRYALKNAFGFGGINAALVLGAVE